MFFFFSAGVSMFLPMWLLVRNISILSMQFYFLDSKKVWDSSWKTRNFDEILLNLDHVGLRVFSGLWETPSFYWIALKFLPDTLFISSHQTRGVCKSLTRGGTCGRRKTDQRDGLCRWLITWVLPVVNCVFACLFFCCCCWWDYLNVDWLWSCVTGFIGANINAKTQTGDNALTYACENGHTDVVELLLKNGMDLVSISGNMCG